MHSCQRRAPGKGEGGVGGAFAPAQALQGVWERGRSLCPRQPSQGAVPTSAHKGRLLLAGLPEQLLVRPSASAHTAAPSRGMPSCAARTPHGSARGLASPLSLTKPQHMLGPHFSSPHPSPGTNSSSPTHQKALCSPVLTSLLLSLPQGSVYFQPRGIWRTNHRVFS